MKKKAAKKRAKRKVKDKVHQYERICTIQNVQYQYDWCLLEIPWISTNKTHAKTEYLGLGTIHSVDSVKRTDKRLYHFFKKITKRKVK